MPIDWKGIGNAYFDLERKRLGMPSREEFETQQIGQASGLLGLEKARDQLALDREMAPLERQARVNKLAAEAVDIEDRGERVRLGMDLRREEMEARREAQEADRALKREIQAAQQEGREVSQHIKDEYYRSITRWNNLRSENVAADPYWGKMPGRPILFPSPDGSFQMAYDQFGAAWAPGQGSLSGPMAGRGRGTGGGGATPPPATPPRAPSPGSAGAPQNSTEESSGAVTQTQTQQTNTPPHTDGNYVPPGAAAPEATDLFSIPKAAPSGETVPPAAGVTPPGQPPNAIGYAPTSQMRAMKYGREQATNAFRGIFATLARVNKGNPEGYGTMVRRGVAEAKRLTMSDDQLMALNDSIRGFVPLLARAIGHVGVLTELDVQRTEALFPKPGQSEQLTRAKLKYLNDVLKGRRTLPFSFEAANGTGKLTSPIAFDASAEQDAGGR